MANPIALRNADWRFLAPFSGAGDYFLEVLFGVVLSVTNGAGIVI